ncbi:aldo/keto reductase [Streptomyces sp. NPDC057136]|uniref:aldo/keto reductase n=1 Tax=Streptomyces sp. NPDC057136 TaxID=3346029 RepID=UPI00363CE6BA
MVTTIVVPAVPVPLSPLVLGTMTFGDTADRAAADAMLDAALDAGITGLDTANGYAGGESERILAELLPGRRDQVVLATKAGIPHPDQDEHAPLSAEGLRTALEGSLKRLGTDHVDLFYLHQPDRRTPLAETLATVAEFIQAGKVFLLPAPGVDVHLPVGPVPGPDGADRRHRRWHLPARGRRRGLAPALHRRPAPLPRQPLADRRPRPEQRCDSLSRGVRGARHAGAHARQLNAARGTVEA